MAKGQYEDWINEEGCSLIEGWARQGLKDNQIYKLIGVSDFTFYAWLRKYPQISHALKKGRSFANVRMENALYKTGIEGNVVAQIFWLKKRDPERWGDEVSQNQELLLPRLIDWKCWASCFDEVYEHILSNDFDYYFLKGGRGSGKSTYVSLEIIQGIIQNPNANAIIYRKVEGTIRDSVYNQMIWAIDRLGFRDYFRAKVSPYRLIYEPTGQEIIFKGCDDPLKSKSIKPTKGYFKYCWLEEVTEFNGMEEVENLVQSIARSNEGKTAVVLTYNPPQSSQSWVNEEVLIPQSNRLVHHSTYLDVPAKYLSPQFINIAEETKKTNEAKYRHVYLGEVTGTGGEVFDNVEVRPITDEEIEKFDYLYTGLDFGFSVDPVAIVQMCYRKSKQELYIFREFFKVGASFDTIAQELKKIGNPYVTADSAEPRSIEELRQRGCKINSAKKGAGSVEHGLRRLQDLAKIVIDPSRCPNTAREFSTYEYERDKYGNFKSMYPDVNNHSIDAVRYALEKEFKGKSFEF